MIHLMLHHHLRQTVRVAPLSPAVSDRDRALDYAGLDRAARGTCGALLEAGVRPGDRVVLIARNAVEFATAFWGTIYAGAVIVPVNPSVKAGKLGYMIEDCAPTAILACAAVTVDLVQACEAAAIPVLDAQTAEAAEPPDTLPADALIDEDLGCIVYTSGSTGAPKGVTLSHRNLTAAARGVNGYLGYRPEDRIFVAVPLTFDYGMHQLTIAALVGASVVIETDFAKPLFSLDRAAKAEATVLPLVPTMVPMVAKLGDRFDLGALRLVTSTAAAFPVSAIAQLRALRPQATVFSMYGLTECHRCTYLPPAEIATRPGSVGLAIPGTQMWVVDAEGRRHDRDATGELVIRGATVMRGYWNNPEATARRLKPGPVPGERVLHTGDLVRLDAEGFAHFISRSDDILKVHGEKVAPKEVEDVLLDHPEVAEAVVFGAVNGSETEVRAVIVCRDGGSGPGAEALRAWCAARLDPIAVPRRVAFQPKFARTANGKVDRAWLLEVLS